MGWANKNRRNGLYNAKSHMKIYGLHANPPPIRNFINGGLVLEMPYGQKEGARPGILIMDSLANLERSGTPKGAYPTKIDFLLSQKLNGDFWDSLEEEHIIILMVLK